MSSLNHSTALVSLVSATSNANRERESLPTKTIGYLKLTSIFTYLNYVADRVPPEALDLVSKLSCKAIEDIPVSVHKMNDFDIIKYAHNQARQKYGLHLM